jgi:hypothetical protein
MNELMHFIETPFPRKRFKRDAAWDRIEPNVEGRMNVQMNNQQEEFDAMSSKEGRQNVLTSKSSNE